MVVGVCFVLNMTAPKPWVAKDVSIWRQASGILSNEGEGKDGVKAVGVEREKERERKKREIRCNGSWTDTIPFLEALAEGECPGRARGK